MSCEREQQKVTDLLDAISLAQDQCSVGIRRACASLPNLRVQLAKARTALNHCQGHALDVNPPAPTQPCDALQERLLELQDEHKDAQEGCAMGLHGECARIPGILRQLARAQEELRACLGLQIAPPAETEAQP